MNEEFEEEEFELPFQDASPIFPTVSSSRVKTIDISGLQPFTEVLASFLYNTALNPLVVYHLLPNIPFQKQPQNLIPPVMAQPTFPFPLPSLVTNANLKNLPPNALLNFYGLATEDPDTFLFEFGILCHCFDYNNDAHKINLFLATLKESSL